MTQPQAHVATTDSYILGEGPLWDAHREQLHWVDIKRGLIMTGCLSDNGSITVTDTVSLPGTVGTMAPSADGPWIVGAGEDLVVLDGGSQTRRIPVLDSGGKRRFNDGKADARGRYLIGTLAMDGASEHEQLFMVEADGSYRVLDNDLTLANGMGWNGDGTKFFSIDTLTQRVFVRDYNLATGATGERSVLFTVTDGHPDGMCVDADDHLWVAIWGGAQVRRYSPTGELVQTIAVPAPNVTSVTFAGPQLDTLVITTAADGLSPDQLAAYPHAGHLFTVKPGVAGLPQPLWGGFTPQTHP